MTALPHLFTAFAIAAAAGLFTVLGSAMVIFPKRPTRACSPSGWPLPAARWCMSRSPRFFSKSSEAFAQAYGQQHGFSAATLAFLAGLAAIALIDRVIPNPHETLDPHDPAFRKTNAATSPASA